MGNCHNSQDGITFSDTEPRAAPRPPDTAAAPPWHAFGEFWQVSVGDKTSNTTRDEAPTQGPDYDALIKCLLIGDPGTGKSAMLTRWCRDAFTPSYISTIGADFGIKTCEVRQGKARLQIWDTPGEERSRTITSSYFRGADVIFLVFDLTCEDSLQHIGYWADDCDRYAQEGVPKYLIGNKGDMKQKRCVDANTAVEMAERIGALDYIEVSAKEARVYTSSTNSKASNRHPEINDVLEQLSCHILDHLLVSKASKQARAVQLSDLMQATAVQLKQEGEEDERRQCSWERSIRNSSLAGLLVEQINECNGKQIADGGCAYVHKVRAQLKWAVALLTRWLSRSYGETLLLLARLRRNPK